MCEGRAILPSVPHQTTKTMPLKVLRESYRELQEEYALQCDIGNGSSYVFDCDKDGNVEKLIHPDSVSNYEKCVSGQIKTIRPPYVKDWSRWVTHPMVCECHCGQELPMYHDYEGIVYCNCGKMFNTAGQELRPRSQWEERYDDDY
jgi:hypothetical protein